MAKTKRTGFYGWRLLFFLGLVMVAGGYIFYGPPVLFPLMIEETGWSRAEISLGYTATMAMFGVAAPVVAWAINRFGARVVLFVGGLTAAVGTALTGLFGDIYPLYLIFYGVMAGIGMAEGAALPAQTVVVFWFNRYRALALSLIMAGIAVGGFIAPPAITWLVSSSGGNWRLGRVSMGILMAAAATVSVIFVRNQPADLGQYPDGITPEEARAGGGSDYTARTYRSPVNWSLTDVLRTRQLWLLGVAMVGGFFIWQIVVSQGPLHLRDRGFDAPTVSLIYGVAVGLTMVGRLGAGLLGDRIEPRVIFLVALWLILIGAVLFWMASPQALWAAWGFPFFGGIGIGAVIICMSAMMGNYWGPPVFPSINAVLMPMGTLFGALAGPLAGFIYDSQGSYFPAMLVAWVGIVIAFGAMLFCTPPHPRGFQASVAATEADA